MSNVSDIKPKAQFILWGSGYAIKRAGSITEIIKNDELGDNAVIIAKALSDSK